MTVRAYLLAYVALMSLLAITCGVSYIDLGSLNAIASVGIAILKAVLIGAIFMHLKIETGLTRIFIISSLVWFAILLTLSLSDYLSRHWFLLPGHWPT